MTWGLFGVVRSTWSRYSGYVRLHSPRLSNELPPLRLRAVVRERARRGYAAVLRCVPDRCFTPLRLRFPATAPMSASHRVQHALLMAARYRGVPPEVHSFPLSDNPSLRIVNADSFIVEWLYWFGERYGYEAETIRWWKSFCRRSSNIVDFGANIGYYAIQGASVSPSGVYKAVEPHPGAAALCRRNLDLNGITNVEVVEAAAVSDASSGDVELVLPGGRDHYADAPCGGFIGVNAFHDSTEDRSSYSVLAVRTVAVSALITSGTDLVKMDVEGQEHLLLAAVLDQLRESRPTLFLELLDNTPNLRHLIVDELLPADYHCYVPFERSLVSLTAAEVLHVSLVRDFGTRDIILTASQPNLADW